MGWGTLLVGVVILGVVYIPPEYTAYSSPDAFGEIESEYLELSSKYDNIFMVGDFNARTASEKDYIFIDENDKIDELEYVFVNDVCNLNLFNIPIDRNSMDKGKNRYGNQLLELCKCNSLFIMNGRLATDIAGKFTCRNASVVDYCLCNVNFIKNIISLDVLEFMDVKLAAGSLFDIRYSISNLLLSVGWIFKILMKIIKKKKYLITLKA